MTRSADPTRGVHDALLELRLELSLLNHRVALESGLNDIDLDCLDFLSRHGPTSPARLGRRLGIHPATMTGILSRLVDSGWIERTTDPADRRASVLRISPSRDRRLKRRYAAAMKMLVETVSSRSDAEVAVVVGLMRELADRAREAG